ncbi:MAG: WD40 repeat domain-containing protein [Minisyncoccia bacterium]
MKEGFEQFNKQVEGKEKKPHESLEEKEKAKQAIQKAEGLKAKMEQELDALSKKLWQEKWKQMNPKELVFVEKKKNYQLKETLRRPSQVWALEVLPDDEIISGNENGTIEILEKDQQGKYQVKETLEKAHKGGVRTFQVLSDHEMVSGGDDGTIKFWEKDQQGKYQVKETLEGPTVPFKGVPSICGVTALEVLPDEIVAGYESGVIRIWKKDQQGKYQARESLNLGHQTPIGRTPLQVLADHRIVAGEDDGWIQILKEDEQGNLHIQESIRVPTNTWFDPKKRPYEVNTLQVLPDGRIFAGCGDHAIKILDGEKEKI